MSLWHTELEIALWALEDLPLESTGLTTVISNLLSQAFVYHQCRIGFVEDRYSRMVTLLHSWIELPDGWCIDLTLRKWLDDDDDIPHGVFRFFDHPRVKYQGSPLRVASLHEEQLEALTDCSHYKVRIPLVRYGADNSCIT
ncbi:hypothetical protein [Marinobacter sp. ES-1]|uniref:hypothetical protein n=1 Tax=Marinobacter sp. ES-1 TaxID=1396858 RepID=UPI0009DB7C68|nr:hypothetical protein [Marinobacter sp. ES-1]